MDDADLDVDDQAMKLAREYSLRAIQFLIAVMLNDKAADADRVRAAETILGVGGCLSL